MILLRSGRLCSTSGDGMIKVWNIKEATCERILIKSVWPTFSLVELPNEHLISGGYNQIRFWNLKDINIHNACTRILTNKGLCSSIILLSNDEMACGSDNDINLFSIYGPTIPLKKLTGHRNTVTYLLLHPESRSLFSCSRDKSIRMWNIQTGYCIRTFQADSSCTEMVWFKENVVATGYSNGEIKFWNIYTGECLKILDSENGVCGLMIDSEGNLISVGNGRTLTIWG